MKHLRIYESFVDEVIPTETDQETTFETQAKSFVPTEDDEEGDYLVTFDNADGEETTLVMGHANDPEYTKNNMVSSINMIPDSSSDGREYSIMGYYREIPGSAGAFELEKVLIQG